MAQEPIDLKDHIDAERTRLGRDLEEIENRMKDAVDWRTWYEKNTALVLGVAAAGGLLVSLWSARRTSDGREVSPQTSQPHRFSQMERIGGVIENSIAALIGVGTEKLQDYVSQRVPGFREQYHNADVNRVR
jgi:hypothetical protein